MDIQKEREAFEVYMAEKYKNLMDRRKCLNNGGGYMTWDMNVAWQVWQAAKANAVPAILENDCMIGQTWFMKGSSVAALIKHAEGVYKAEVAAQNSKIEFGTDDNEHWFAHDVPFFGTAQIDRIEEHGLVEWDIHFNDCWQGPFNSKSECIKHLEECILDQRAEAQEPSHD